MALAARLHPIGSGRTWRQSMPLTSLRRKKAACGLADLRPRVDVRCPRCMLLLPQIAAVLGLARIMRRLFVPLKQPAVIAEMVAGLMLGPSCLGWPAPP